jgi:prephenate dehydrogenase
VAEVKFTPPATVAIGGLGVIGGSVALALKERGVNVVGFAGREDTALARKAGILTAETLIAAVRGAELVLLAVPVRVLRQASIVVHETTTAPVLHVASVQRASSLGFAPGEWVPVGTHPLAGSHRSGFAGADPQMFRGARISVETRASAAERAAAQWLWTTLGAAKIELRDADAHDRQVAWISHLPQLASVGLAAAIAGSGEKAIALGPGGRDATRLAGSRFDLWREIVGANADDVAKALEALEAEMRSMREAIVGGSDEALKKQWERARAWRESAGGKQ